MNNNKKCLKRIKIKADISRKKERKKEMLCIIVMVDTYQSKWFRLYTCSGYDVLYLNYTSVKLAEIIDSKETKVISGSCPYPWPFSYLSNFLFPLVILGVVFWCLKQANPTWHNYIKFTKLTMVIKCINIFLKDSQIMVE